jgi:hypothetical protein
MTVFSEGEEIVSTPPGVVIGEYASIADAQTAIQGFVSAAGLPWLVVGDITTGGFPVLAAINFANGPVFDSGSDSYDTPNTGVYLAANEDGQPQTNGYAPYENYAGVQAALGNWTLSPSS